MIYLDNQTSTKPCKSSLDKFLMLEKFYGKNTSLHKKGTYARNLIQDAKEIIEECLDTKGENILFSSSYTEVINTLFSHLHLEKMRLSGKNHLMILPTEKGEIYKASQGLKKYGCTIGQIPIAKDLTIDLEKFEKELSVKCCFVSIPYADNLTGIIYPIDKIAKICRKRGVLFHVDVSSAFGKIYFSKHDSLIDYLTLSGEAIHSLSSTGLCISKDKIDYEPSLDGTIVYGFAFAVQQALLFLDQMGLEIVRLRNLFEKELSKQIGAKSLFSHKQRLPNVSCLCFPSVHQQVLFYHLNEQDLICTYGQKTFLDNVLKLAEIDEITSHSSLSFALSRYTTEDEITKAIKIITNTYIKLKNLTKDLL